MIRYNCSIQLWLSPKVTSAQISAFANHVSGPKGAPDMILTAFHVKLHDWHELILLRACRPPTRIKTFQKRIKNVPENEMGSTFYGDRDTCHRGGRVKAGQKAVTRVPGVVPAEAEEAAAEATAAAATQRRQSTKNT